jgi:hypothetical protein
MDQNNSSKDPGIAPSHSADFGNTRNDSESFSKVPNGSESFGSLRNDYEHFGSVPNVSERKENHTLTVREVARLFEVAGVARTERSITNWCQPSRSGIARLDAYFDPNERRYFITPQSAELAIQEEKAKAVKRSNGPSELFGIIPNEPEKPEKHDEDASEADPSRVKELEKENMDLKITNRAKDYFIEQLKGEREIFVQERQGYVEKLMDFNRKVGELETKLLRLETPKNQP